LTLINSIHPKNIIFYEHIFPFSNPPHQLLFPTTSKVFPNGVVVPHDSSNELQPEIPLEEENSEVPLSDPQQPQ